MPALHVQVVETPELYERVVRPYIESLPASRIEWVYNILNKTAEAERLIFEDPDPVTGAWLESPALGSFGAARRRHDTTARGKYGGHLTSPFGRI